MLSSSSGRCTASAGARRVGLCCAPVDEHGLLLLQAEVAAADVAAVAATGEASEAAAVATGAAVSADAAVAGQ